MKSYGKYKKKSHIIAVKKEIKEHIKSDFYKKIKNFLLADFILKFKQKIRKITGKPFSDSKNVKLWKKWYKKFRLEDFKFNWYIHMNGKNLIIENSEKRSI